MGKLSRVSEVSKGLEGSRGVSRGLEGSRRVSRGLKGSGNISLVLRYVFPHVRKDTTKVSQHIDNDSILVSFKMNFKTDETLNV
jgi:hypothetical protein